MAFRSSCKIRFILDTSDHFHLTSECSIISQWSVIRVTPPHVQPVSANHVRLFRISMSSKPLWFGQIYFIFSQYLVRTLARLLMGWSWDDFRNLKCSFCFTVIFFCLATRRRGRRNRAMRPVIVAARNRTFLPIWPGLFLCAAAARPSWIRRPLWGLPSPTWNHGPS